MDQVAGSAARDCDPFDGDRHPAVGDRVHRPGRRAFRPRRRHRNPVGRLRIGDPDRAVRPADAKPTGTGSPTDQDDDHQLNAERILTLIGLVGLAVGAFVFDLDVGFTALGVAVGLTLIFPKAAKGAVDKISWGTVLLIGGIVTYVSLLEDQGTVTWLGDQVAGVGVPLLAAFLICLIGAVVSAFASTTGILGALIPLAVPFLMTGQVGRHRPDHRTRHLQLGGRLQPLLHQRRAGRRQLRRRRTGRWSSSGSCSGECPS